MKRLRLLLTVVSSLAIFFAVSVFAAEPKLPACNDLIKITDSLDVVSDVMKAKGEIKEGSEAAGELERAIDKLSKIAQSTANTSLGDAVKELSKAKKEMNWTQFKVALGKVTDTFDEIHRKACT